MVVGMVNVCGSRAALGKWPASPCGRILISPPRSVAAQACALLPQPTHTPRLLLPRSLPHPTTPPHQRPSPPGVAAMLPGTVMLPCPQSMSTKVGAQPPARTA